MINSVRLRLTLWYAGVLALVLVLFAAAVYSLFRHEAYARLDDEMGSAAQVISSSLRHEIEEHRGAAPGEDAFRGVLATLHRNSFRRQGIAVYRDGRGIAAQASYDGLAPDAAMAAGARPRFATRSGVRVATYDAGGYRVLVVQRLDGILTELNTLRRTILFAVPLTVLLAAAVSYLLARKSLQPVVAMSRDADRIGSGNLAARIEVANPRDELGQLAGTFNRLLERLQISFDRQRHFMADASHELRTPVSVARTAAQVNLTGPERPAAEYREALELIEKQMSRLSRIVNDLFLLAQADTGAGALHARRFALEETIRESVQAARLLAPGKKLDIGCGDLPEAMVRADEDRVRQLLMLLLDNAVKYTPEGGRVRVSLERADSAYRIAVEDTGIGIPAEAQPRVFERFYRVDKSRSRAGSSLSGAGAGLGLSIGQWIANAHGGRLSLERSGQGGSRFVVTLPAAG